MQKYAITPAMRFAAHDELRRLERLAISGDTSQLEELQSVRRATYIESFPKSYSGTEVLWAQQVIFACYWRTVQSSEA